MKTKYFLKEKIYKTCKFILKWNWNLPEEGQKVTHQVCEGCVGKLLQAQNQEAKHKKIQPRCQIKTPQSKELLASESKRVFASLAPCWGFPDRKQWFSRPRPPSRLPGWRQSRSYKYPPHVLRVEECVCFKWNASSMENTYTRAHTFTITQAKTVCFVCIIVFMRLCKTLRENTHTDAHNDKLVTIQQTSTLTKSHHKKNHKVNKQPIHQSPSSTKLSPASLFSSWGPELDHGHREDFTRL